MLSAVRTLVILLTVLLVAGSMAVSALAGTVYDCVRGGEVHQFWGCVDPEKPPPQSCQPTAGNPVDVITGRKHQEVVDWSSGGQQPLELVRRYSSSSFTLGSSPYSSVGRGWRTNFDARIRWNGASPAQADWVHVVLPDHFEYHFNKQGGVWKTMIPQNNPSSFWARNVFWKIRSDLDASVTIDGDWIVFRAPDDTVYVFDSAEHAPDPQYSPDGFHTGLLTEIRFRGGYSQRLSYSGDYLARVADTFGRWLEFDYAQMPSVSRHVSRVRTSNGQILRYSYQNRFPTLALTQPVDFWSLSTVVYPDATPSDADNPKVTYEYLDAVGRPGLLLSGIVDERGVRFASWTYDAKGRVLGSEHAGGTDRWQFFL